MGYDLGDTVPIGVAIRNAADALVNPSTIVLTITLPDGTTATPTPVNDSTGLYSVLYVPTQAGRHLVRWVTTTPNTAHTDAFDVSEAAPPLILSLAEAKAALNIRPADTDQDDELRDMLEGLTSVVEKEVGAVVRRTRTSILRPCGDWRLPLPYSPVISATSATLVRDASSVDVTGWYADGSLLYCGTTGFFPYEPFTLTYVVGRPDLPANIRKGAVEILRLAWASQRASEPPAFLIPYRAAAWLAPEQQTLGFS